jgi:peptidoglycan/LPS O-acetylase OafA/YrhL
MRHSANLDILRSLAVASVLVKHLVSTGIAHAGFHNMPIIEFTDSIGRAGVIAFFVHTSLVLMYSLERMACSTDRVSLRFYVRRFFRIYPLSVFCILAAVFLHIPNNTWKTPDIVTPQVILADLFLVQNVITKISVLIPLWSLPYEVQMYLVLPALYYLALKKRGVTYLCGLMVLFCALGFLIAGESGGHLNMAAYVPCFLSGVLCYSLRDRIRAFVPSVLWPPFVLLLISAYCLANLHDEPSFWKGWVFCILLALAINTFHDSLNKPLNLAAEKIALYSYGVYLIHVPVLYLVFIVLGIKNFASGTSLVIVLTMAASIVAYHFIESPCIELGRRLSSRPAQLAASHG